MEVVFESWIQKQRSNGFRVTGDIIKKKAREYIDEFTGQKTNFKASNGWLPGFLKRYSSSSFRGNYLHSAKKWCGN